MWIRQYSQYSSIVTLNIQCVKCCGEQRAARRNNTGSAKCSIRLKSTVSLSRKLLLQTLAILYSLHIVAAVLPPGVMFLLGKVGVRTKKKYFRNLKVGLPKLYIRNFLKLVRNCIPAIGTFFSCLQLIKKICSATAYLQS
jgi:hypothetical protein